jgi:aconitate hydratase
MNDDSFDPAALYRRMEVRLAVVRARLRRPLTLAEKILFGHLDDPQGQAFGRGTAYLGLRPDRVVFQDVLGQSGLLQLMQTGRERVAVPTTVHCDHLIQARRGAGDDLREAVAENDEVYRFLRAAASRHGAGFWGPGSGIVHQVVLENYAAPGLLLIGTDSHTPNAGGLAACAVGVGGADAVEVIAGLPWELFHPRIVAVHLTGALGGWTAPKDVILHLAGRLGVSGATNAILEYVGPGARSLSATGRATIANMGAELGATTSIFPADEKTLRYLRATGRDAWTAAVERFQTLLEADEECEANPEDHYDDVVEIDLARLEPHVGGPHSPDRTRPISALAAEARAEDCPFPDALSAALVGSCTNSSYEDLSRAADVARQARARGLSAAVPLLVTPGSESIRATTDRDGQLGVLAELGATVLASACGPCIGQWRRADASADRPNSIVTTFNRNFAGRNDGHRTTSAFLASPELVVAFALAGRLSFDPRRDALVDANGVPFRLAPPAPAPDVPERGFMRRDALYVAPRHDPAEPVTIDPASERLAPLPPWPAWDGRDRIDLPILVKTKGKTTTDQISPAGPWLRFRGHLERFSDNLLSGAVSAFGGEPGTTLNALTGETGRPVAEVARAYRAAGIRWVIVGDANYGEGSSREHAALSPRLLGGVAVIARSFARIHETNLKKQGLLALTFDDPADYERIGPRDRLSLIGLAALAPGAPVTCVVRHPDGTSETLALRHSYGASQIEWFRAGSALAAAQPTGGPRRDRVADERLGSDLES